MPDNVPDTEKQKRLRQIKETNKNKEIYYQSGTDKWYKEKTGERMGEEF